MTREVMEFDIVVVGAGPARLSAADHRKLLNKDLSLGVLEEGSEI